MHANKYTYTYACFALILYTIHTFYGYSNEACNPPDVNLSVLDIGQNLVRILKLRGLYLMQIPGNFLPMSHNLLASWKYVAHNMTMI